MFEYIQFRFDDDSKFSRLQDVFQRLKSDKNEGAYCAPETYLSYFDDHALSYFVQNYDFDSMIENIVVNCEYKLQCCELISDNEAQLTFEALSHTYGGTEALQALIKSFGFEITEIVD